MHSYPWLDSGNTIYKYLLGFQLFLTLVIGFYTDTMVTGMLIGSLIVVLPFAMFTSKKGAVYTRHIAAIASQLLVALHIQQSGGATFMHFEIFAVMAATTVYRDWKIVVSSVLTVAIHHIGFYALQTSGSELVVFEQQYLTLYILAIHAGFAVCEGLILCFISNQAFKDGRAALDLQLAIEKMMRTEGAFDLNVSIDNKAKTSIQFIGLIEAFSSFISQTKLVSSNLSSVSSNVSALSDNVRTASSNTTSQVHTIAAAIEEMTVNNEDVSQRASSVSELSNEAKVSSMKARGTSVESNSEVKSLTGDLQETAQTIGSLSDKCKQIESVMASISAISDQTNLLALNAAIESARAGEHGRGFAVVADEVRQLAMRTKENSTQISEITHLLIQESTASVAKMQSCVDKSEKVAGSSESTMQIIDEVVDIVGSVNDNIESVSAAINEQSLASSEISKSTQSLSTTSEVLSANASKTDEASADLTDNIEKLQSKLSQFTL